MSSKFKHPKMTQAAPTPVEALPLADPPVEAKSADPPVPVLRRFRVTRAAFVALSGFSGELQPGKVIDQAHYDARNWTALTTQFAGPLGLQEL